jgi:hypothetical protein
MGSCVCAKSVTGTAEITLQDDIKPDVDSEYMNVINDSAKV